MLGQILEEVIQKNYPEEFREVYAGEFINQFFDKLFADGIVEYPFETLLADLNQCAPC